MTYSDDRTEGSKPVISPLLNMKQFTRLTETTPRWDPPAPMRRVNLVRTAAGRHGVLGTNPNDHPHDTSYEGQQKLAAHLGLPTDALDAAPLSEEEKARMRKRPVAGTGIRFGMN